MAPSVNETPSLLCRESAERSLRLKRYLSRKDAIDQICDNITNGGSVPGIAKVLDVSPGPILTWLRSNDNYSKRYQDALKDRDEWEKEQILTQLRAIGSFDIRSLFNGDGELLPVDQWPENAAVAIAGIQVDDLFEGKGEDKKHVGYAKKLKLIDRIKALQLSGKQLAMFKDEIKHSGHLSLEELVCGETDV